MCDMMHCFYVYRIIQQIGEFYGDGLVAVDGAQFDIRGIGHAEVDVVKDWADAWIERGVDFYMYFY